MDIRPFLTPIRWSEDQVHLIDQRVLPVTERWIACADWAGVAEAIVTMAVRGAPAIGIAAAYGVALAARASLRGADLQAAFDGLAATRPTAVNLFWALDRLQRQVASATAAGEDLGEALLSEAQAIHAEDLAMCQAMGDHGAALLPANVRLLTHCNTGSLATGGYGTALGVVRSAARAGKLLRVYADETRPFLQGSRLTAWELARDGLPVRVITDNMAAWYMRQGEVDAIVVGTDRIAANGDVANKIGTYGLAVLAQAHNLPFYVVGPTSTIDLNTPDGDQIPIEQRPAREVTHVGQTQVVPDGVPVENPAFDVTPAHLVTAIITEHGVLHPPYAEGLRTHVGKSVAPTQRSVH